MRKIFIIGFIVLVASLLALFVTGQFKNSTIGSINSSCPNPLAIDAPVDLSKVTAILYPGQVRGGDYKKHGGFRFDNAGGNMIEVKAPFDAVINGASRYIEIGEVQYLVDFETECGIRYRFDHLLVLSPKLSAALANLPAPKPDDSRTSQIPGNISVKKGEVIATSVGFKNNVFVDLGVYESKSILESPNSNPVCWFELLTSADAKKVRSLPSADGQSGTKSDICK